MEERILVGVLLKLIKVLFELLLYSNNKNATLVQLLRERPGINNRNKKRYVNWYEEVEKYLETNY